jgi:GNAT superfamily N-acetyltransferase/DNA-binding MarR family transcriptional regulator
MDLIAELGHLALASRLKRLGERLQQQVSTVYGEEEVGFRARWFPVLTALSWCGPQAISELAQVLGLTHTAVIQIAREMEREELVASAADPADGRRRVLRLSPAGVALVARLGPLWEEIRRATAELVAGSGHDLLAAVAAVEERLGEDWMATRLRRRLHAPGLQIVDYRPEHAGAFRSLNLAWLEPAFGLEEEDRALLDDPEGRVLAPGGAILVALGPDGPAGVCALVRHGGGVGELAKMAVAEPLRGQGIGRRLCAATIARARALGMERLFLLTSPRLEAAGRLYRSLGFREAERPPVPHRGYARCSIVLEMDLASEPKGEDHAP